MVHPEFLEINHVGRNLSMQEWGGWQKIAIFAEPLINRAV